jgi:hypothetical protein
MEDTSPAAQQRQADMDELARRMAEASATPTPEPPGPAEVVAERQRRLGLGFDYDFGDARGTHRIGTTDQDMAGWDEVTKIALARHATGSTAPIAIVTDTGPAEVSPAEWLAVLEAANAFRQPIWQASFALQATEQIPADYAADRHWTA